MEAYLTRDELIKIVKNHYADIPDKIQVEIKGAIQLDKYKKLPKRTRKTVGLLAYLRLIKKETTAADLYFNACEAIPGVKSLKAGKFSTYVKNYIQQEMLKAEFDGATFKPKTK